MKKKILILCTGLLLAILLCACDVKGNPLPEGMEESAVLAAGEEVLNEILAEDWQAVYDRLRDDAKAQTDSPDAIRAHVEAIWEKVGAFKSTKDSMTTGQKLKESGEQYATVVFYCQHEKNQAMYRIAFSTELELIGLQVTKQ